jgi:hypothetical protein
MAANNIADVAEQDHHTLHRIPWIRLQELLFSDPTRSNLTLTEYVLLPTSPPHLQLHLLRRVTLLDIPSRIEFKQIITSLSIGSGRKRSIQPSMEVPVDNLERGRGATRTSG